MNTADIGQQIVFLSARAAGHGRQIQLFLCFVCRINIKPPGLPPPGVLQACGLLYAVVRKLKSTVAVLRYAVIPVVSRLPAMHFSRNALIRCVQVCSLFQN